MGTSAEALKIMSCFKVELIIILRLRGQRTEPENKKKKKKKKKKQQKKPHELTFLFTTIYNNENEGWM